MSKKIINSTEEMEAFIQVWKYLSANGKLFIPVLDSEASAEVYAEEDTEGNKVIRAFLDAQAIDLYIQYLTQAQKENQDPLKHIVGTFKAGITPVKHLQKQLTDIYGRDQKNNKVVECLLTSYDELGNMQEVDIIWTQAGN